MSGTGAAHLGGDVYEIAFRYPMSAVREAIRDGRLQMKEKSQLHAVRLDAGCGWCGRTIEVIVADHTFYAGRAGTLSEAVADIVVGSLAAHQNSNGCAAGGHDPGDEDAGEAMARLWWSP